MVRDKGNAKLVERFWGQQRCVLSLFHLSFRVSLVVKWDQLWKEDVLPSSFSEADSFQNNICLHMLQLSDLWHRRQHTHSTGKARRSMLGKAAATSWYQTHSPSLLRKPWSQDSAPCYILSPNNSGNTDHNVLYVSNFTSQKYSLC